MKILNKEYVNRVGRHEAGHYVVARLLGFCVDELTIKINDEVKEIHSAGAEIILAMPLSCVEDVIEYAEKRLCVLYAGALSEALINGKVDEGKSYKYIHSEGSKSDFDKIREITQLLRNMKHPESKGDEIQKNLDEIGIEVLNKTQKLIESESELIMEVANKLASKVQSLNKKYNLTDIELKSLPLLTKRFSL